MRQIFSLLWLFYTAMYTALILIATLYYLFVAPIQIKILLLMPVFYVVDFVFWWGYFDIKTIGVIKCTT